MKNSSNYRLTLLSTLALLVFSTIVPALAYAAPLATPGKDWQYMNGNSWAWNYSPQKEINKNNVNDLEVKWIFPVGSKALAPKGLASLSLSDGVSTPPIVRNGVVFITTQYLRTYGIDAETGKQLWINDYDIDVADLQKRLPLKISGPHFHGIRYWEAGDMVLVNGIACDFYGIDPKTGKTKMWVKDLCANVPGNVYSYTPGPVDINNIGTYEKGGQFIFSLRGNGGSWVSVGRNVIMGIDINSKQILWRVFNQPPQDQPVKDWALQECDIGYFQVYTCKEVAAKNLAGLEWDWAQPGQPPSKWGGVSANWAQPVIDEDAGILYTQTGNQSPYTNLSLTPGPRLYGSTIMAIDMNAGKRNWWVQVFPHEPYDFDCNWNGILAETRTIGKVYMKICKEGILYTIDTKNGKPIRQQDLMEETYPGKKSYHLTDPFSYYDLREWGWPEKDNKHHTPDKDGWTYINPSHTHGYQGSDMSYDPETQILYHYGESQPDRFKTLPLQEGRGASIFERLAPWTSTITARDVNTGKPIWTWFYGYSSQRAHMVVSADILFTGYTDGKMRFFNKATGELIREMNIGVPVVTGPTIAQDSAGESKIFVIGGYGVGFIAASGVYGPVSEATPGTLIALGLSEKTSEPSRTTTVTTTLATTLTATESITQTTGLPSEVTYAAIGVAIIALIVAAVLVMRKK